jgi:hypothetical protein
MTACELPVYVTLKLNNHFNDNACAAKEIYFSSFRSDISSS